MTEGKGRPEVSSSKSVLGSYERLRGDGEPTRHVCVMGVSERDDEALRELSLFFGKVSSIERNAKVGHVGFWLIGTGLHVECWRCCCAAYPEGRTRGWSFSLQKPMHHSLDEIDRETVTTILMVATKVWHVY